MQVLEFITDRKVVNTMEIIQEKRIEDLCKNGVIIATQDVLIQDNIEPQNVGDIKRISYGNSERDRERLAKNEPEDIVTAVMAIFGDTPTVTENLSELLKNDEQTPENIS